MVARSGPPTFWQQGTVGGPFRPPGYPVAELGVRHQPDRNIGDFSFCCARLERRGSRDPIAPASQSSEKPSCLSSHSLATGHCSFASLLTTGHCSRATVLPLHAPRLTPHARPGGGQMGLDGATHSPLPRDWMGPPTLRYQGNVDGPFRPHRFVRRSSPSASDVGRGSTWS